MTDQTIADVLSRQTELLELLARKEMHTKTPANFGTATELHGNGSLFGSTPVERDVITAHIRPHGLYSMLPRVPTVFTDPRFASITGYTDTNGNEATYPCSDNPAGYVKACNLTAQFGRLARDSQTIEINDVMLRKNRGDFTDLMLRGRVLGGIGGATTPAGLNESEILNVVTMSEMVIMGVNIERKLNTHLWQGNPANNTAGGGYKEFPGLDRQIATGQVDADTNAACPALDSDVKDFAYNEVGGAGLDIVEYLSMLAFYLNYNAEHMGLTPVQWVIVMRPELWYELSAVWPCRYNSFKCSTIDTSNIDVAPTLDSADMTAIRDAMRNGGYLDVNGVRYPVITDTGIFEHTNANNGNLNPGEYASSIYMIPLSIQGNFPVTYIENMDYRQAARDVALLNNTQQFWSDDGLFYWAVEYVKWCLKLSVKTEQRVVLRTPQLAGRIDSVMYTPLQHLRSPDPASSYFMDGGVSMRSDDSSYHVW